MGAAQNETKFPLCDFAKVKTAAAAGAGADTNIAVTGIVLAEDSLLAVFELAEGTPNAITDRTSVASITSDGNIQLTVATTGDQLMILWIDADG